MIIASHFHVGVNVASVLCGFPAVDCFLGASVKAREAARAVIFCPDGAFIPHLNNIHRADFSAESAAYTIIIDFEAFDFPL